LEEYQIKAISYQLLKAIKYMHKKGYVHRDIKLENILVMSPLKDTNGQIEHKLLDSSSLYKVLLGDLGLTIAYSLNDESVMLTDICGSPTYCAPEILQKIGYREKVDLFSLGSLIFNLFTGRYLFSG
jgi:serine/threonine protein kinase